MTDREYEQIYTDFINRRQKIMTVEEISKIYSKVFEGPNDKPVYIRLASYEFQMLLLDLSCMYMEGHTAGVRDGLDALRG